jgi:protoporphyrinogen/coproporphyrinogen III oxidase
VAAHRSDSYRVAVVGGGVAGLAAAYRLTRDAAPRTGAADPQAPGAGHAPELEVTLFEADHRLGGHIISEEVDGYLVEGGPDCFVSQKPWGLRLAGELGMSYAVTNTAPAGATYVLSGGRLHPLPDGVMLMVPTRFLPLARSRLISWPGKLRMGLDLALPRGGEGDETLGAFVSRRLGREALEKIAEPLVAGVHAGDPDRLSLQSTFARFKQMEQRDRSLILAMLKARRHQAQAKRKAADGPPPPSAFVTLAGGLGSLVKGLAATLPAGTARLGVRVTEIERWPAPGLSPGDRPGGETPRYGLRVSATAPGEWEEAAASREGPFDAVILASPAGETKRLVAELDPALAAELAGIGAVSAVTVSLGWPREHVSHPLDGFGLVVPRREGRRIMGVTWTSSKFPGRVPPGRVLVRAFLGGVKGPEVLRLTDDGIVGLVRGEIDDLLGVKTAPELVRLYRWPEAMPQYNVGHAARLVRLDDLLLRHPGLLLAGGSYRGIGIPDSIQSGIEAAERALAANGRAPGVSSA